MTSGPTRDRSVPASGLAISETFWPSLLRTRANVLASGPQAALEAFLDLARCELRDPVRIIACERGVEFMQAPTLILRHLDQLSLPGQAHLASWLDDPANADTQVVSFTTTSLYAAVRIRRFDRDLYYRLNTITLAVTMA